MQRVVLLALRCTQAMQPRRFSRKALPERPGCQLDAAFCYCRCRRVALYAVDSLRQLVAKLLARAELEHFTHQEDALRPFVAVLRQCDEACVRELAVQCVMQVRFLSIDHHHYTHIWLQPTRSGSA